MESQAKLALILVICLTCLFGSSLDIAAAQLSRLEVDWDIKKKRIRRTTKEEEGRKTIKCERTIEITKTNEIKRQK